MMNDQLDKIHELEIMIAKEIRRICEKHDIRYFLTAGSTLGAVRHKGFIPWDDDMDMGMLREDYDKFLKVCEKELGGGYYLQTWDTDPGYPFSYAKVRLNGTHMVEEFSADSVMNDGIFVDIFPYDAVPDGTMARKLQSLRYFMCKRLLWIKKGMGTNMKNGGTKALKYYLFSAFSHLFKYESIKNYFKKTQTRYNGKHTKKIAADGSYKYSKESIERSWAENLAMVKFEDTEFPTYREKEEYLSYFYGDYMKLPPEDQRGGHLRLKVDFGPYSERESK